MSAQVYSAFEPLHRRRGLVCGVCVRIADTVGVPVWVPRAAFVILAIPHAVLSALLYVGAAAYCHRRAAPSAAAASPAAPRPAPRNWPPGDNGQVLRERFSRLEARLAAMEAEALHNEADLRRGFRDLDTK